MIQLSRRNLLASMAATSALATFERPLFAASPAIAGTKLRIQYREIAVGGKTKKVFGIQQPNGKHGLILGSRDRFRVELSNAINDPLVIHWHGQEPPAAQDGVPELTQYPIPPRTMQYYDFEPRPGTHWMHSHLGFQEQDLMAAPLIVRTTDDERADMQEVVIMLHDFTFQEPEAILADLGGLSGDDGHSGHGHSHSAAPAAPAVSQGMAGMPGMPSTPNMPSPPNAPGMQGMDHSGHTMPNMSVSTAMPAQGPHTGSGHGMAGQSMSDMKMDLNDVNFDAYLANDRTLEDPELVRVEPGGRVRLRIINAAAATNFFIDLGTLTGRVIATDGNPVRPVEGKLFPLAIAQRLDILLDLPRGEGAYPILAQREGEKELTGIILATPRGPVRKLDSMAANAAGPLSGHKFETMLSAIEPLSAREPDRRVAVKLSGDMNPYQWSMSGHPSGENLPIEIAYGERVRFELRNETMMPHPMHLHGHHFQVVGIAEGGRHFDFRGAVRDTVLVAPGQIVAIDFDAVNPGRWAFHCHMLYHQATGMMSEVRYTA